MNFSKVLLTLSFIVLSVVSCVPGSGNTTYNDGPSNLKVSSLFKDGMYLDAETDISVWGEAFKTTKVTVEFLGEKKSVVTNKDGTWKVQFPKRNEGGPYLLKVSANDTTFIFKNLFIKVDTTSSKKE